MRSCRALLPLAFMVAGWSAASPSERTVPSAFQAEGAAPRGIAQSVPVGPLPATERLRVRIGLPLRDPEGLADLRAQLHDPASPSYHQWLSTEAFTERFGPTAEDYAKVAAWARAKGLEVTHTASNRIILNISGSTADLENAFGVRLLQYRHPSGRVFRSPDRVPTLDLDVAVDSVAGLNDLAGPVKRLRPRSGSGPGGSFRGGDYRKAYATGVPSTIQGSGQGIALLEFSDYYPTSVAKYWVDAGMAAPTINDVPVDGGVTANSGNNNNVYDGQDEVSMDIELAGSMAPSATLYVYEGDDGTSILNQILTDGHCKAVSISWGWLSDNQTAQYPQTQIDATQDAVFQAMDAQGIACFVASGDSGPWTAAQWNDLGSDTNLNPVNPADVPYITCVGGTTLSTSSSGAWTGEVAWYSSPSSESTGGPSRRYTMPAFQALVPNWASIPGASTSMRNCPDVVAVAENFYVDQGSPTVPKYYDGTSGSAPIWAGFFALLNEEAGAQGLSSVGNLNTILYQVGTGSAYASSFHDVTSGNDGFAAQAGFDMASGWGSMVGQATLTSLLGEVKPVAPSITGQPQSLAVTVGETATFTVTAAGTTPMTFLWSKNNAAITGATSASYTTPAEVLADSGASFTVTVTNSVGSVTSAAAILTVDAVPVKPAITAQPQDATVLTGATATFSVTATGTAPLSYQWYLGTQAIGGGTSATLAATAGNTPDAAGTSYHVVVSNPAGSATSNDAKLYVTSKTLDLNGDGTLDVLDLAALAAAFNTNVAADELDGNATVDDQDIVIWLAGFGGNP